MNMLPFTNAPRLPNIGFISTSGAWGTRPVKRSRSASVGFGLFIGLPPAPGPPLVHQDRAWTRPGPALVMGAGAAGRPLRVAGPAGRRTAGSLSGGGSGGPPVLGAGGDLQGR